LAYAGAVSGSGHTGDPAITGVAVGSGTFVLSETAPTADAAAGYRPGAWACDAGAVEDNGDGTAELTLGSDDLDVSCTIENTWTGSTLTLVKQVDDGGEVPDEPGTPDDWTLNAAGPTPLAGASGTAAVTAQEVLPGTYALAETLTGTADPEYSAGEWACTTASGIEVSPGALGTGTAELTIGSGAGADITCTLINEYRPPHLTLTKTVDGGGPLAEEADWTLSVTGGVHDVDVSAPADSGSLVDHAVGEGTFALAEAPTDSGASAAGYASSGWTCDAGSVDDNGDGTATLTLDAERDRDVTCAITNTWTGSQLSLEKIVDNGSEPPADANAAADWTLSAVGADDGLSVVGSGSGFITAGTYTLSEAASAGASIDPDYRAGAWTCAAVEGVTVVPGAEGSGTATLTIEPGANADIRCTITNTFLPPHITLVKTVVGGGPLADASDWTLTFSNADTGRSGTGTTGDPAITNAPVGSGTVSLSEVPGDGYTTNGWTCDAGTVEDRGGGAAELALDTSQDTDVTCAITNTWTGARLSLVKQVDDGGEAPSDPGAPEDWTLSAVGGADQMHVDGSGNSYLMAGDYTLTESANTEVDPDYRPGEWSCTPSGGLTTNPAGIGTLHLDSGDDVTCTLTNLYKPPHLTLVKTVEGGPLASVGDWTLSFTDEGGSHNGIGVTGDDQITGVAVGAGMFTLTESPTAVNSATDGYTTAGWTCDGANSASSTTDGSATVLLDADDLDVTCTITNTWTGGNLTLIKQVEGGTAAPGDWTLTAAGPTSLTGTSGQAAITTAAVLPGDYTLAEAPASAGTPMNEYVSGTWNCAGATLTDGNIITIVQGTNATCTVTNTYDPPRLTLIKHVIGEAAATSWALSAVGPSTLTGTSGQPAVTQAVVEPGDYRLSESAVPGRDTRGYVSDGWTCAGADLDGDTLALAAGDDVTCTVTNRYTPSYPISGSTLSRTGFGASLTALVLAASATLTGMILVRRSKNAARGKRD
jgi:hypothetical protein